MDLRCDRLRASAGHALLVLTLGLYPGLADAGKRSAAVRAEFQRSNPCPSTGAPRGRCPGWQADHRHALCLGGADVPENLQWLTIEEHKRKTRVDVRLCRGHP